MKGGREGGGGEGGEEGYGSYSCNTNKCHSLEKHLFQVGTTQGPMT